MKRTTLSTILLLCFIVAFSFSGVNAVCTAKDTTVSTYVSHYYTLYSLSSAAVMLLPLIFEIDGIWYSIIAAELVSAAVTAVFFAVHRKKYRYF